MGFAFGFYRVGLLRLFEGILPSSRDLSTRRSEWPSVVTSLRWKQEGAAMSPIPAEGHLGCSTC